MFTSFLLNKTRQRQGKMVTHGTWILRQKVIDLDKKHIALKSQSLICVDNINRISLFLCQRNTQERNSTSLRNISDIRAIFSCSHRACHRTLLYLSTHAPLQPLKLCVFYVFIQVHRLSPIRAISNSSSNSQRGYWGGKKIHGKSETMHYFGESSEKERSVCVFYVGLIFNPTKWQTALNTFREG